MTTSPLKCVCADLPARYDDANLTNVTPVAANIDVHSEIRGETWAAYRCLDCGQWWRDGFGDDHALRKLDPPRELPMPAAGPGPSRAQRTGTSPQEKKRHSLEKDGRNAYGENAKASRKNIPRAKARVNRANRRVDTVALTDALGVPDEELATVAEQAVDGKRRKVWRKQPDEPLGRKLARRAGADTELPSDPTPRD